ncbi:MAG: hypothetical protein IIX67_00855, partial [Clostridia bacterium]|nr:hypothetical protein [Clostridia bacterium]
MDRNEKEITFRGVAQLGSFSERRRGRMQRTALNMPTPNLIILIVMIVILSNVDPYIIQPMVHSRNTKI